MKYSVSIFIILFSALTLHSQVEQLSPATFNSVVYNASKKQQHKYLIDKGQYIIFSDTLSLPFIDDFSSNTLRSYKWAQNNITASYTNVFGTCLGPEGITTIQGDFISDSSYTYSYDTLNQKTDSTADAPMVFTFFGPGTSSCFSKAPQTSYFWKPYYRYIFNTDGTVQDTVLVNAGFQTINYAPLIHFVPGEPNKKWFDNYAFWNTTYPILPPTIGVATLDGLNEYGLPYNNTNTSTFGDADYLTSYPINLNGLGVGDSVYLSFFFEGKGLGDKPEVGDSLILEFRDVGGVWDSVWGTPGYATLSAVPNQFKQVLVLVPDRPIQNSFFHNSFQFRFRNKAALYGAVDQWHVDYIKLDAGRSEVDTIIQDIAFVYPHQPITKNFSLMPADQFVGASDLNDTLYFTIQNLDPANPTNKFVTRKADMLYPSPSVVAAEVSENFNIVDFNLNQGTYPFSEYNITGMPLDSFVIKSEKYFGSGDAVPGNDTLKMTQIFSNIMAYDDGSAEAAYGLSGVGLKKVAVEFPLAFPDTLVGIQIMYNNIEGNVGDLVFNFSIWDSIKLSDVNFMDEPIATLDNKKPFYVDSANGYTTYLLDTPRIVSNKVYAGWVQTDERSLQVGFDFNSGLGLPHLYAFYSGNWHPTVITDQGSLMFRLIFDTNYWGTDSYNSIKSTTANEPKIQVFPNPAQDKVYINSPLEYMDMRLYNMLGSEVLRLNNVNSFSIAELPDGIYFASFSHNDVSLNQTVKIVKQ
jgi:hypothetical protein